MFEVTYDPKSFNEYISELHSHLFNDLDFDTIVKTRMNNHRKERFISMYLLKDKSTFNMYRLRSDLMLDNDYQRLIFALGQLREKNKAVLGLVAVLGIMHFEVDMEFSNYEVNVINKDINAYLSWKLKRMLKTLKR